MGTNPLLTDSDGDSVSDGDEVKGPGSSNPLASDSDEDGFADATERRLGTDPNSAAVSPTLFRGAIGIQFVSGNDIEGALRTNEIGGPVPQVRWNVTTPIRSWNRPLGSKADIASPIANHIVRSDGLVVTNFGLNWSGDASDSSRNSGTTDRKLMNGFVRASASVPLTISVSNVPFARYDVYVLVGGSYDDQRGRIRLGSNASTDHFFRTTTTTPQATFTELKTAAGSFQKGNLVRFTNQTSSHFTLTVTNVQGWAVGVHALQIVDAALDADASGIPEWFEMKHTLQPATAALSAADSDGDGLSNLQEFQRGSNPRLADTDSDGLLDSAESLANALNADSDGDGLSDYDELNAAIPSNPNIADTDGDGISDREENRRGLDPMFNSTNSPGFAGYVPVFRNAPDRWEWTIENVQLVWDHGSGALAANVWNEDFLFELAVRNPASSDWRTLGMALRYYNGSITHLFHSERIGGFSSPNQPTGSIWDSSYGNPPADLQSKLGFSGFGPADMSSRLKFRLLAQRAAASNAWVLTFSITNQTSNTMVVLRSFTNSFAANAAVNNGSATWVDYGGIPGSCSMVVHQGVRLFITTNALENLPEFAASRDRDKDGMPDVWETAHNFNLFSASDAILDADVDGLNNRDEFLAGTNPRAADTDGDGISDSLERENASDPLLATSKPQFTGAAWPEGEDIDGSGLPDAWEIRYGAARLQLHEDADGDGVSNFREAVDGTDPFNEESVMFVNLSLLTNDVLIRWPFIAAKTQSLHTSGSLTNWALFEGNLQVASGVVHAQFTNRVASSQQDFYRVTTEDRDSDGDGVSDWAEGVLGSDAYRQNSVQGATPMINSAGSITGLVAGDYAAFAQQMLERTGLVTRAQAARLLQQATFGPTLRDLDRVQQLGLEGWIGDQITNQPPTLHRPYIEHIYADFDGARTDLTYSFNELDQFVNGNNATTPFARAVIAGPDQLRQRVAFALSQILVASRRDPNLENKPLAMTHFYDIFVRKAFGNYFDVLREVTFHPVMGRYLSHIGNQKARPEINQYPDENYAREVQQLFTIGLWELNLDGTRKLDPIGQPIPTYGNAQITEFARVFTGLWFGGQAWGNGGWSDDDCSVPMQMWADKHDFGIKTLLNGFVIPARTPTVANGIRDVDDALRHLFDHPNTPPFVSRQLIQFMVTSNPSTGYVARVASAFRDNGAGQRGDLGAVVRAILMDEEARHPRWFAGAREFGRLKEPVHRAMAIARVARLHQHQDLLWWSWGEFNAAAFQEPGFSPSVFNFFRPGYQPPGLLTQHGLVGPAFQITDSYSSISFPNKLWEITCEGLKLYDVYRFPPDYADLLPFAGDSAALADQVGLLFCGGVMSSATRDHLLAAINQIPTTDRLLRIRMAVFLAAASPEGAIQR